jgi:hypothetical protein
MRAERGGWPSAALGGRAAGRRGGPVVVRLLGAVALLAVGIDHLVERSADHYGDIPTIGTLFALDFGAAALIAGGLVVSGRAVRPLAAAGVLVAAGSLAGLLVSERTPLFGFRETGYRPAIVLAIALDAAAILLLGAVVLRRSPGAAPVTAAAHHQPVPARRG